LISDWSNFLLEGLFIVPIVFLVALGLRCGLALIFPRAWLINTLAAHFVSLSLVGSFSTIGFGAADFPTISSIAEWSLIAIGPYQGIALILDLVLQWASRKENHT